jgi:predicted nucleic acid-binding protein
VIAVLDASAAMEIALDKAEAMRFKKLLSASDLVLAPDIYPSEITNAFWKYGLYSGLEAEKCEKGIDYCLDLVDDFIPTSSLCKEVFSEAMESKHPAYDLFYIVLARRNGASILTMDKKLRKLAKRLKVKTLGEDLRSG